MTTIRAPAKIIPRAFPEIKPEEVQEIIINSRIRTYPPGTVVCRENELEHVFYMILEGDFEVLKNVSPTESRLLTTLTAGDYFGEMALIHNAPRAATVRTKTSAVVLELDKEGFNRVLKRSPSVAMAMVREISGRLRKNDEMAVEDLRLRATELAEAYQKLAEQEMARREFLTSIAHELRTPLMIASGYLHNLKKGAIPEKDKEAALEAAVRNIDHLAMLVNDVLSLQELDLALPEFQPVNIVEIAERVVQKYQGKAAARQVNLKLKGDRSAPPVKGDPVSLERALTGLVDNAVKFSSPNKSVEVRIMQQGERVVVSVEDQGPGIPKETLPRIFDRFFHVDSYDGEQLYGGLGLGLSITKQVIEQHDGSLTVDSEPGRGSVFSVSLLKW